MSRRDLKPDLRGQTLEQLKEWCNSVQIPAYRGQQVWTWLHRHRVVGLESMTNVPLSVRDKLANDFSLHNVGVDLVQVSSDGTRKFRLKTHDGYSIETVLIPDGDKLTQCISSQVGCALGCQFCATAKLKLTRHLTAGEIVHQVYLAQDYLEQEWGGRRITNIVYMGMGEPLHNYENVYQSFLTLIDREGADLSRRKITLSTVGLVPAIRRLSGEEVRPNLAVSLNASMDSQRNELMPVNKRFDISELLAALKEFPLDRGRRITFEYVLLAGVNDTPADAKRVAALLQGIPSKLNIIPWNPHEGAPYKRPSDEAISRFQHTAKAAGVATYLRTPRGDDIAAACGQLANKASVANGLPVVG